MSRQENWKPIPGYEGVYDDIARDLRKTKALFESLTIESEK